MKKILAYTLALSMLLSVLSPALLASAQETFIVPESPSGDYNMNPDWKFSKPTGVKWPLAEAQETSKDAQGRIFYDPAFDDSSWDDVSLPHTFNDEDSFRSVAADPGEGGAYRGISFYRKHFSLPAGDKGKKVIMEFEGVRQAAYVYLNGSMVGYYEYGVSPFGIDLSDTIRFGEDNVIAVAIDNTSARGMTKTITETKPGSVPGSCDGVAFQWNTKDFNPDMGGITRNVILHVKNPVYQTLPLYSNLKTKGTYVYAKDINVKNSSAQVYVESEVRNESDSAGDVTLEVNVVDDKGMLVSKFASDSVQIQPAKDKDVHYQSIIPKDAYEEEPAPTETDSVETTILTAQAKIENLRLWAPDDPYLYDVYAVLKQGDSVIDTQKVTTGFRSVEMKGGEDGGVFINGKFYWLTGYAQRSTNEWAAIGIAPDWLRDYDAQLIKESNANYVRWMHVSAQPADIRAFDKYGIVSVQPAGDKEGDPKGRQWDQRMEVMRDTMVYFRNSPSILFWEAGNSAVSAEHMKETTDLRKKLDPHGMRAAGSRSLSEQQAVDESEYVGTMLGRNVWDGKQFTDNGKESRDKRVIIETEYHREESPRRVWDDYSPPDFDYINVYSGGSKVSYKDTYDLNAEDFILSDAQSYNEFYQSRMQANSATPFYSAAAALCWSDSNQHGRQQASENARMSGRVDPVRIKKQSFYAYQVMQSEEPALYLVGHWNYPEDPNAYQYPVRDEKTYEYTGETALRNPKDKTVYVVASHCARVDLLVNGEVKGSDTQPDNGFIYAFEHIDITQHGQIEAVSYDGAGKELARQKIETVGEPQQIRLTPVTGPDGFRADGSDIAYIDVEICDAQGRVCPLDYERIDFEVTGPAEMLGGYNSGVKDLGHSNDYVYAECGTNRIFLRAGRDAGAIKVTAKRSGMQPVSIVLNTKEFQTENGLTKVMPQVRSVETPVRPPQQETPKTIPQRLSNVFDVLFGINTGTKQEQNQDTTIEVLVNDRKIEGLDAYRMVGLYGEIFKVLDAVGAEYTYDQEKKELTASANGNTIVTSVKNSEMLVNGQPSIINDWPEEKNGTLYAEISAILDNLGYQTYWDGDVYHVQNGGGESNE
jgi:beta-galactosidase